MCSAHRHKHLSIIIGMVERYDAGQLLMHLMFCLFVNTIFVSSHMYPENPEGTQVIVGSLNMG